MSQPNQTAYFFDSALCPPIYSICGVQLRPFCLGHYVILRQFQSPISAEQEVAVTRMAGCYWLFHALLVCAQSYEDNLAMLGDPKRFDETVEQFNKHIINHINSEPGWNLDAKLRLFKDYINYFMEMPYFDEKGPQEAEAPSGIDWVQNLFVAFKKMGYNESEILNMNMRKLLYEWTSEAESQGAIRVWNKTTLQQYLAAKGMMKKGKK